MCLDDDFSSEPYENDLDELGNREAFEDAQAEKAEEEPAELATFKVPESDLAWANGLLAKGVAAEGFGRDQVIKTWSARFEDGLEVDLKLVNSASGPYIDAVLFEDGCEVQVLDPDFTRLEGDYHFSGYTLHVEEVQEMDPEYRLYLQEKADSEEVA